MGGTLELTLIDDFVPQPHQRFDILAAETLVGQFANVAPGQRLETTDGLGSFVVNYGAGSPFHANQVVLSDFLMAILAGDYNNDGLVGAADLNLVLGAWGDDVSVTGVPAGWVNDVPTGLIGAQHLNDVLANWGATLSASLTTVPEPSTLWFVLMGMAGLVQRKQAR